MAESESEPVTSSENIFHTLRQITSQYGLVCTHRGIVIKFQLLKNVPRSVISPTLQEFQPLNLWHLTV